MQWLIATVWALRGPVDLPGGLDAGCDGGMHSYLSGIPSLPLGQSQGRLLEGAKSIVNLEGGEEPTR